jgi:hemolysin activation/secretion protein
VLRHAPSAGPGAVELVAQLKRKPYDVQFQYDNRGSGELGPNEGLLSGASNSFTNFGERIEGLFFNTFNREQIFGQVNVSAFIGDSGLRALGYAGRGNSEPGGVLAPLKFDNDLTVASAGLSYPLIRSRRLNLSLEGSLDYYDSPLLITVFSPPLRSEASLRILRGGGSLDFQDAFFANLPAGNLATLKLSQGLPTWGAFSDMRLGNTVAFTKVTSEVTRVQTLPSLGNVTTALKVSLGGQYTEDVLPPSEKYFLGGFQFGRGFFNGEITGDRALGSSTELQFNTSFHNVPIVAEKRRLDVQFYGFFDYGKTWDLGPLAEDEHIASFGIGARSDLTRWMFVELEGVRRLTTNPTGGGPAVNNLSDYAAFSRLVLHY